MRHIDIITPRSEPVFEHAFPLSVIRSKLMDRTYQINRHLLLIMAFTPTQDRNHWKSEVKGWMREIGGWKSTKKGNPPVSAKDYLDYLWRGPFMPHEQESVQRLIDELARDKPELHRNQMGVPDLVAFLRDWHQEAAQRISTGQLLDDLIDRL